MSILDQHAHRILEDGDCLRWTGACAGKLAHPAINVYVPRRKTILVRRLVWEEAHGPIPPGKIIRCTCGTPRCIALAHLELTTFAKLGKQLGAQGIMSGPVRSARIAAVKRAGKQARISQEDARAIRNSDEPLKVLAKRYGISESSVSKIRLGHYRREFGAANPWQGLGA